MGAVAVTNVREIGPSPWGSGRVLKVCTVTWSSSYATGGDTLASPMALTLGLRQIFKAFVGCDTDPFQTSPQPAPTQMAGGSYEVRLGGTAAAPTLILRKGGTTPVEETAATNVSGVSATLILEGQI